jgi:LuxR family maltose regulon positive regulatory protein
LRAHAGTAASLQPVPAAGGTAGRNPTTASTALFANFLRAQLAREHPDELLRLHLAASAWYESVAGLCRRSTTPSRAATFRMRCRCWNKNAQRFLEQGRMRLLKRWLSIIPPATLREHPLMQAMDIWAVLFTAGRL